MENYSGALLASAVLLLLAITGPDLYADARMVADWNLPYHKDAEPPMKVSGNPVWKHSEISLEQGSVLYGQDISDTPLNLTGDSARQNFEVQVQEKENEDRWVEDISFPPGFATLNALPNDVQVRCEGSFPEAAPPVLVNAAIHSGDSLSSPLYVIDPGNNHVRYECIWAIPFTNQYVSRTAWADVNHQGDMPLFCLRCLWKVQNDGLYLLNSNTKAYIKVKDWCTPGSKC
jgi:hypothetical protein